MLGNLSSKSNKKEYNYSEPGIGDKILLEYGTDVLTSHITGIGDVGQMQKLIEFRIHMAEAALRGDNVGITLSCFSEHGEPFNRYLPIFIHAMPKEVFENFVELLRRYMDIGLSKSVKQYLKNARDDVKEKANNKNPYALWLMGSWYAFDDSKTIGQNACMKKRMYWYEKAAFEGYIPAMQAVAALYDEINPSFPTDLKKSAFWYRHGALFGDAFCAYNLGVMYVHGDFVEQNLNVAEMWLSVAYRNSTDSSFTATIVELAKQNGIHLSNDPDMSRDPEVNGFTAEFQDACKIIKQERVINKNSKPTLEKSKKLMNTAKEILAKKTAKDLVEDESWMQRLWDWADENKVPDYKLVGNEYFEKDGYYTGLPRDKEVLLSFTELDLREMELATLPPEIGNLKKLTRLNLGYNKLTTLPKEIGKLTNLSMLELSNNKLTSIPQEITNLTNLISFGLSMINVKKVPQQIWEFTSLQSLSLDGFQIGSLPKKIGNMKNLTKLYLSGNQIIALPSEIGNLANLTTLILSYNKLIELPNKITNLVNLVDLSLENNINLKFTIKQKNWIFAVKEKNGYVYTDELNTMYNEMSEALDEILRN